MSDRIHAVAFAPVLHKPTSGEPSNILEVHSNQDRTAEHRPASSASHSLHQGNTAAFEELCPLWRAQNSHGEVPLTAAWEEEPLRSWLLL